ncbi:MAG: FtsX-like permease family protein [Deltaproteobacteria bacterium]|nr:MAG: FtsX-like permease family protein [Deltaproteobacteria bacterium]
MRYEWLIGLRYLRSTRRAAVPSLISVISMGGVAVGVATLLVVLAVLGGFEGDLREKILGTKAHLRVTAPGEQPLPSPREVLDVLDRVPGVVGAAPFIESELLVSSPTNYSGMILRGIDLGRVRSTSDLEENLIRGQLDWLATPAAARELRDREPGESMDHGELQDRIRRLLDETAELEAEIEITRRMLDDEFGERDRDGDRLLDRLRAIDAREGDRGEQQGESPTSAFPLDLDEPAEVHPEDHGMPALPGAAEDHGMPALPRAMERDGADGPAGEAPGRPGARREAPGIIIGSQLREALRVDVGDLVNVVSPDGDMGPSGPVPRSRPFRVVGIFHSGLYEFDNRMAFVLFEEATRFLNLPEGEASGIEVRAAHLSAAPQVARAARSALQEAGVEEVQIRDWQELNETLFAALALEKVVMFLILSIIILVASFAIVCMLIVIVIEKSREIAVLRSMGASRAGVLRIFLVEGGVIGVAGTLAGMALGLGVVASLQVFGFPLDPEVFYIDRLPVALRTSEAVTVGLASVTISVLATLYPSVQAARLDPVAGLRYD